MNTEPIDDLESLQARTDLSPLEQKLLATALFWKNVAEDVESDLDAAETELWELRDELALAGDESDE